MNIDDLYAHGRHHVAIDISSAAYTALTDGKSRAIPFQINSDAEVDLSVKLEDDAAFADMHFMSGDNPALVVAIEADALITDTLFAIYPFKPATTTIASGN